MEIDRIGGQVTVMFPCRHMLSTVAIIL